ncbi:DUF3189 family protein [Anaerobacillus isosaccharinicus]|uniref:ABC transporter n=1 Tax=Anaerobacillus isosaccharinicus TaxID=1532552 RepID=A0A1S2LLX8_9BACI|nr:DUF3189 family protein [Anaerobacillus isosaccharinicus]MBA5585123.1 DUF3189 family protein [Anaerobacillus isosaccharinicus]QOY36534.1 DUF3189 family protein [Anaerobacillus isosaccharinicus]
MIYIYNCYGGTHSSALAAAYHLNRLPKDRIPTKEEILNIDIFNKLTTKDMGRMIYHGNDEEGHKVYTVGRGSSKALVPALKELLLLVNEDHQTTDKVILSNASPTVPIAMTFGGLFSRRLRIHFIGVPLLIKGAQQTYHNIITLVEKTKSTARTTGKNVEVLENKNLEVNKLF